MDRMTSTEILTRDFLTTNSKIVKKSTIEELSEIIHVSPATIIRTVKKMGYSGFSEYKNGLINQRVSLNDEFSYEIAEIISKNLEEVEKTIKLLKVETIEKAVKKMNTAKRLFLFSTGTSCPVANYLQTKLQLTGLFATNLQDDDLIIHFSQLTTPDDCIIIISQSGQTRCLIEAAKNAKKNETKIITLTASKASELPQLSDILLLSYKSPLKKILLPIESSSRFSIEMTARILSDSYIISTQGKSLKNNNTTN